MKGNFPAVKVSDHVYWVGAIDWGVRDFHGYLTSRGTTYNAYLVLADKITLVDTVRAPFMPEMFARIASVIDPQTIKYIISNHSEMDHSGGLPEAIKVIKPEKVFASIMGAKALQEHFHPLNQEITPVKDGEGLSLGNLNLSFTETRMIHWPDSMFTYVAEDNLLFSQDGFGMHLASSVRFADEIDRSLLVWEAGKYFANILLPFAPLIIKLLEKVNSLGISVKTIAPDHGPIWRTDNDVRQILGLYSTWAAQKPTKKGVVVYDTMWQSTAAMARAIGEGLAAGGLEVKVMSLKASHRSDVITEILNAGALLVGSPTMNNNVFPTVADAMTYIKGLRPQNLIGAAFGSYGWGGEAVGQLQEILTGMRVNLAHEGLKVKYVPDAGALEQCYALGLQVADKLKEL